jgi:hypothetical protein
MRHHPRRRALEEGEALDLGLDVRHRLDRGGAGADHGDPAAGQVVIVVPARRVEGLAGEVLEAGQRRYGGCAQEPRRREQ